MEQPVAGSPSYQQSMKIHVRCAGPCAMHQGQCIVLRNGVTLRFGEGPPFCRRSIIPIRSRMVAPAADYRRCCYSPMPMAEPKRA